MKKDITNLLLLVIISVLYTSCEKKDMYTGYWVDDLNDISKAYMYPYKDEGQNIVAEISITTDGTVDLNSVNVEIPHLKYNKSLLFMLTQDDCKQSAFCTTWATIHNRPLSDRYYYDYVHLKANDLPPNIEPLGKTLGSTDGCGNEVRFSFTTTVAPEWEFMDAKSEVALLPQNNEGRFAMKAGLTWRNLIEMQNYDTGIAFHDVNTEAVQNIDSIKKHYEIAQNILLKKLFGRGCKALAEPNGNKNYVSAASDYAPIQTMTAQAQAEVIYPFKTEDDLYKTLQYRAFDNIEKTKAEIQKQFTYSKENVAAIHIGVHNTDRSWSSFLLWLNNNYGKDGIDEVWMPSMEEYYEYNYNRVNGSIKKTIEGNTIKLTVTLPGGQYFYFPSSTINLTGVNESNIIAINSSNSVTGLSYGNYPDATIPNKFNFMLNIDCRSSLIEHAEHYVKEYEENTSDLALKADALYFVNRLKDSDKKNGLLQRIK